MIISGKAAGGMVAVIGWIILCAGTLTSAPAADVTSNAVWLEKLDVAKITQEWGDPHAGKSVLGKPLKVNGKTYEHGVGTHSFSEWWIDTGGGAERFEALGGVDDEIATNGSVIFEVWADGRKAAATGIIRGGQPAQALSADLKGVKKLVLIVTDAGDSNGYDHADWLDAKIIMAAGAKNAPRAIAQDAAPPPELSVGDGPKPAIHGPRVVGATPGRPFLFLIPATGKTPMRFSADNLPAGIKLDEQTGILSGSLQSSGNTDVRTTVSGPGGRASRRLTIVGGEHKLALTPPMGWNSWNVWGTSVDAAKVRAAADAMVKSGLAAHGYCFINIDDAWEGTRDANGEIRANEKIGDMKTLADYVHSKGLKLGVYSSPGPKTCASFEGSYQHEQQDANTYAKWGIDYLKYDWCSMGRITSTPTLEQMKAPYRLMRTALDNCGRDIVFSFCQYGMGKVWEWGAEIGGNLWRTSGDIGDSWGSMASIGFSQTEQGKYACPGHWNDPDMLVVGKVGWGPTLHNTKLTPHEQLTHITLWSLLASPLLIGCDMTQMDDFTSRLLTNDEVLDVNQDPLGRQAGRRVKDGDTEIWSRQLWDGTLAVGLFNRGSSAKNVAAKWTDLGISGSQPVRDLWRKKDLGHFSGSFESTVQRHGAMLLKIGKPNQDAQMNTK
ncbi:MAG: NPCBM/NEW2 domain-containing protein [Candidatus Sumerlaeota bacterium]|nr:NPCBM/NEW2 domain-containing protein [Candidatus Sumerlaeota bacterium]